MTKITPTIATYDKYWKVYDQETVEFWNNFPKNTIKKFKELTEGNEVLDLGSGPGRDALLLRSNGYKVTCLDASSEMIKKTKSLGFTSIKSSFEDMDFNNNLFDSVWAYTSLLHISQEDMVEVIKKIYRILKNDGVFMVGMIEGNFGGNVIRESMPKSFRYFRFYNSSELKKIIEELGFVLKFEQNYMPHSKTYLNQIYKKI